MNKNSYILIAISTFAIFFNGSAQNNSISGTVHDGVDVIPSAKVSLNETEFRQFSNLDGEFKFSKLDTGVFVLRISSFGLSDFVDTIRLNEGENINLGKIKMRIPNGVQSISEVTIQGRQAESDSRANNLQKQDRAIGNVEYVGDGNDVAYNAADNLQKMPAVTIRKDQGEGRYMSIRGTPPNWNSTLINGDRLPVADEESETRTMAFDVISSDLLEYIKVGKALTPDMEGDAIGGAVNFITKSSPDSMELRVNLMGGYNAQAQKPIYNVNLFFGTRSKNKKLGMLFNATSYVRNYGTDNFEVVYGSNYNHGLNRLELRDYTGVRSTYSGNLALDYKFKPGTKIYLKGMVGSFNDNEYNMKTRYNYAIGAGSTVMLQHIHDKMKSLLYGGEIGFEHAFNDKWNFDMKYAYYSNEFGFGNVPFKQNDTRNGYYVMNFEKFNVTYLDQIYLDKNGDSYAIDDNGNPIDENGAIITDSSLELARVKLIGADNPQGDGDSWNNIQPRIKGDNRLVDYEFSGAYSELNTTWEKDPFVMNLNLNFEPNAKMHWKVGGKVRHKEGFRSLSLHNWHQDFNVYSDALRLSNYHTSELDLNGGFMQELDRPWQGTFVPFMDQDQMDGMIDYWGDTLRSEPMTVAHYNYYEFIGSTYSYQETAEAGYAMLDYKINSRWSIIGGVRVEATQLKMQADTLLDGDDDWFLANIYDVPGKGYEVVDINDDPYAGQYEPIVEYTVGYPVKEVELDLSYIAPLPMFHVRFDPNKQTVIRGAMTRTYRRPNFIETKPGSPVIDFTNLEYNQGNRSLKPSYSWNLDLSYEYYMKNAGLFSVGLFGKRIKDHIYRTITADVDPQLGIIYKSYQNAEQPIFVYGVELNAKKKFDFFTGFIKDFGVDMNFTYTYSEMQIPGRSFSQSLPMQPPLLFNGALFYENDRLKVRASFNFTDKYLMEVNTSAVLDENKEIKLLHDDTDYDVFMRQRSGLAFSVGYKINRFMQVYAEASNLLNTPFYIYRGEEFRPMKVEYYSIRTTVGMKFKF